MVIILSLCRLFNRILRERSSAFICKSGIVVFGKGYFCSEKNLFIGYKKSYYPANASDSESERLFSVILEEDPDVIRWIKPPLNQLGLFRKAGQQYNPVFLVETTTGKFLVEVNSLKEVTSDEVLSRAREGIKWCQFVSSADPDQKKWEYKLISDDNIRSGSTCKYIPGTSHAVKEES